MNMKRPNPFPYSDTNKRYHTYDYYVKRRFGKKCARLPLDIGLSCPNIDGTKGTGGCIYCSARGSGDFAASRSLTVTGQLDCEKSIMQRKWGEDIYFIPYFQAHTNTYAPLSYLKPRFEEAAAYEGAVSVSIATRADALENETLEYLSSLSERIPVTVELGLQTASDATAELINRRMTTEEFIKGYEKLGTYGNIRRGIHIINGLPGEDEEQMINTAKFVSALHPDELKIHLLYILKNTAAEKMYNDGLIKPMEKDGFVSVTVKQLVCLPPDTVIGRLTGDAPADQLVAPLWSGKKVCVLNEIDKKMASDDVFQGKEYE